MTTAWTYAEATAALPEAGGAASFARRAFNEFVSFGIGWGADARLHGHDRHLRAVRPALPVRLLAVLKHWPYNTIGGIVTAIVLVVINVIGIKEAARLNIVLAMLDLATQIIIMVIAVVLLLAPRMLIEQVHWGVAPTLAAVPLRPRHRHDRLHRHRDDLQHGRRGREPGPRRAAGHQLRAS